MAASATSPMLEALVERLLRPLVLATDDALRRLDLAIEPDDDVSAGPATTDAAPVDGSAATSPGLATQRRDPADAGPSREPSRPTPAAAHEQTQPPSASATPQRLPAQTASAAGPALMVVVPPQSAPAALPGPALGASPAATPRVRASAAAQAEMAPPPPTAGDEFATPSHAPLTAFAAAMPSAGATPAAPVHEPIATWAPPVATPRSAALAAVRTAPPGASRADHRPAAAAIARHAAAAHAVTAPSHDEVASTASRAVTADASAAPDFRSQTSATAPHQTATRPDTATPAAMLTRPPRARGSNLRVAPRMQAAPGIAPHPTDPPWTPTVVAALPAPSGAANATAPLATETANATPRPLRLVASRLDRAMAPVFNRALDAGTFPQGDDDLPEDAAPRVSNTFNVHVALGGAAGALDPRQIEEALGDWLRASARRQGLLP